MAIQEKKIKRAFSVGWYVSLGIFLLILPFIEPLRVFLAPFLGKFVKVYLDTLLNLLYGVFFVCSMLLIILVAMVHQEYRRAKVPDNSYESKLIVRNYYQKGKSYDFTKAIATAISRYSRRDLGPADTAEEVRVDGTHQIFYPTGQLEKEFTYKNGKLSGPWHSYYADGILHQEKSFKDGKLHGVFRAYDDQGIIFFETFYREGQKHGVEKTFHRNGNVQYIDTFENGCIMNRKTFSESGELQFDYDYHLE